MRAISFLLVLTIPLMGCEEQIKLGVEQTISTYPAITIDNIVNNLIRIADNKRAVIAQVTLKESVSTATDGLNYGASPNIALRAIAVTGLAANITNSLNYNWSADPINGSIDQLRLQELFGYAIRGDINDPSRKKTFQEFLKALLAKGYTDEKRGELAKLGSIASFYPKLPSGPFARVNGPPCNNPGDYEVRATLSLDHVCFPQSKEMDEDNEPFSGKEIAGLLALWASAIPDFSAAISEPGASTKGSTGLSVTAGMPSRP